MSRTHIFLIIIFDANILFSQPDWLLNGTVARVTVDSVHIYIDGQLYDKYLTFIAFDTNFSLVLRPSDLIDRRTSVSVSGERVEISNSIFEKGRTYTGFPSGKEENLRASFKITDSELDGIIISGNETFFVEPSFRYGFGENMGFKCIEDNTVESCTYESLIYRAQDVIESLNYLNGSNSSCGVQESTGRHLDLRNAIQNDEQQRVRAKRAAQATECRLRVVADHLFFQNIGQADIATTIAELHFLMSEADIIFRSTDFDGNGKGDNIGFSIAHIEIYRPGNIYNMADESMDISEYLNKFSEYDFTDVCLSFAFTYRNFQGILGLAWVASSNPYGSVGGICQHRVSIKGVHYSLNSGIITLNSYGSRSARHKSALTLTHELGHSFGSPHDVLSNPLCSPGSDYGNYIMYPYANDGSKPNHNEFSPCSISYIYPVILNKGHCFEVNYGPICGNGIVENGEECDCGDQNICTDTCCTPSDIRPSLGFDPPCTFRRSNDKVCSPKTRPCCTENCQFTSLTDQKVCRVKTDCKSESFCNGNSSTCPDSDVMPEGMLCDSGTRICVSGMCRGSICLTIGLTACQCVQHRSDYCFVCCFSQDLQSCQPMSYFQGKDIYKHPGEPCNNFKGYCDSQGSCITGDIDFTMDRVTHMFSKEAMEDVKKWFTEYWIHLVVGLITIFVFTAIFVFTIRKPDDIHTNAYLYGRLARIQREAQIQRERLASAMRILEKEFDQKTKTRGPMNHVQAISRLSVFFPTAEKESLEHVIRKSSSEDIAVKTLLIQGYPLRRLCGQIDI
ncbi:hypothetical protein CHS0354_034594 [Potamilus streckersoni]|uniref:Disintegrin and metalloproteinase domain-containing protein 10 n=1 Tax=Potamilus streckersoni TaxID=2493646 RepID=A0AAE0SSK1_9BIVA|nr:hypothetical protein CHS0354_034594 [Potamilus streckersoni]